MNDSFKTDQSRWIIIEFLIWQFFFMFWSFPTISPAKSLNRLQHFVTVYYSTIKR